MLGNYEKAILIPHPWSQPQLQPQPQPQPQNNLIIAADDQTTGGQAAMAQNNQSNQNPNHNQNNQKQDALRCPRCDSSNTKFCYYNNYSLSQPRHFCKACKRYWTRGGTLRNVPVGGGCRKNKRIKKPTSTNLNISSSSPSSLSNSCGVPSNHVSHRGLLFGVPVNSNPKPNLSYDLQNPRTHMMNGVGLVHNHHHLAPSKQILQDLIPSRHPLVLSNYNTASPSSLNMKESAHNFGTILPSYSGGSGEMLNKEVKVELEGQTRRMDQSNMGMRMMRSLSSSDPSLLWGSGGGINNFAASLNPPNNLGSSVSFLI